MAVPFIDLQRFESDFLERWTETCAEISRNTRFVGGPAVARLENDLVGQCGLPHAIGCANGTDALQLALRALGVGPGDRVLIPDATFWATFEAVVNCGAAPVTVDIDPGDLQMDFELFAQAIDRFRPKAAILVHLYGWGSARLDDFRILCQERELPLLEDGAQAFSVTHGDVPIMRGAQALTLSFYPAKVLGACGDAGAVLCEDELLADTLRKLANHGRTSHYEHGLVGWNSRLGGFEAAYLSLSLEYLPARIASRRAAFERYREGLQALGIHVVGPPPGYIGNGYLNVSLHDPEQRPAIEEVLRGAGIGFGNVYPGAMSKQPAAAGHLAGSVGGAEADRLSRGVINLPLFAYITDDEIDEVLAVMASAILQSSPGVPSRISNNSAR